MDFGSYKYDDPQEFGMYLNPRVLSMIGFDRTGHPIVLIRMKNYFPSKTYNPLLKNLFLMISKIDLKNILENMLLGSLCGSQIPSKISTSTPSQS